MPLQNIPRLYNAKIDSIKQEWTNEQKKGRKIRQAMCEVCVISLLIPVARSKSEQLCLQLLKFKYNHYKGLTKPCLTKY